MEYLIGVRIRKKIIHPIILSWFINTDKLQYFTTILWFEFRYNTMMNFATILYDLNFTSILWWISLQYYMIWISLQYYDEFHFNTIWFEFHFNTIINYTTILWFEFRYNTILYDAFVVNSLQYFIFDACLL